MRVLVVLSSPSRRASLAAREPEPGPGVVGLEVPDWAGLGGEASADEASVTCVSRCASSAALGAPPAPGVGMGGVGLGFVAITECTMRVLVVLSSPSRRASLAAAREPGPGPGVVGLEVPDWAGAASLAVSLVASDVSVSGGAAVDKVFKSLMSLAWHEAFFDSSPVSSSKPKSLATEASLLTSGARGSSIEDASDSTTFPAGSGAGFPTPSSTAAAADSVDLYLALANGGGGASLIEASFTFDTSCACSALVAGGAEEASSCPAAAPGSIRVKSSKAIASKHRLFTIGSLVEELSVLCVHK